jgi:hypothetical protein
MALAELPAVSVPKWLRVILGEDSACVAMLCHDALANLLGPVARLDVVEIP